MDKHLHIIALDVPWPADYGGVVDQFYKIVHLHKLGVKIHLHCFSAGRAPQDELDQYCESVTYYSRKKFPQSFALGIPYIVSSRINEELLHNLQKDDHPILMEGVHCTYYLYNGALKNRRVHVRLHNVEFNYYKKLAESEKNFWKKLYFRTESWLLKRYEKSIAQKGTFWPINIEDTEIYQKIAPSSSIEFLPAFLPWESVAPQTGRGSFCLYHGNLSVNENEKAAEWLLTEVFDKISIPLVIAGKNPSAYLEDLAHVNKNTCLVANPSDKEMQDLIKKAQINILPSFNNTGVKLKLLNALYNGRYCLANNAAVNGAAIGGLCELAQTSQEFTQRALELYEKPFAEEEALDREQILHATYNNHQNAAQMIKWIY